MRVALVLLLVVWTVAGVLVCAAWAPLRRRAVERDLRRQLAAMVADHNIRTEAADGIRQLEAWLGHPSQQQPDQ